MESFLHPSKKLYVSVFEQLLVAASQCVTMTLVQVHDYNQFIEVLQSHCSSGRMSQCFTNLDDEIPLTEVTAEMCNLGSSTG